MRIRFLLLICLLPTAAATTAAAAALRLDLGGEPVQFEAAPDGREVRVWAWGSLTTRPGVSVSSVEAGLSVPLAGDMTVHGPRDAEGRAPMVLLADGVVLTVDGKAGITEDGDGILVVPPASSPDPRASVAIFLAMLILTALMIRHTRRSAGAR